jgi:hypothetical protein
VNARGIEEKFEVAMQSLVETVFMCTLVYCCIEDNSILLRLLYL